MVLLEGGCQIMSLCHQHVPCDTHRDVLVMGCVSLDPHAALTPCQRHLGALKVPVRARERAERLLCANLRG